MSARSAGQTLWRPVTDLLARWALQTYEYFALLARTLVTSVTRPFYFRDMTQQMDTIGVGSLMIVVLTGLFTGMVLALQSAVELKAFGATIYIGRLVGASAVRELGPVLTGLMVTGRAGSGMAAQIGAMKVTEQVDALSTIGVDPIRKLVTPRFLAAIIMMPMLTMVTDLLAIFGGLLIAVTKLNLSTDLYMRSVYYSLADSGFVFRYVPVDVLAGAVIKPVVFGAVMALTGCFYGLRTSGGTEGVGRSTTRAVVTSSILILALDYFLTQIIIVLFIE